MKRKKNLLLLNKTQSQKSRKKRRYLHMVKESTVIAEDTDAIICLAITSGRTSKATLISGKT